MHGSRLDTGRSGLRFIPAGDCRQGVGQCRWAPEIIALSAGNTQRHQREQLAVGLDSFCHDLRAGLVGEAHHGSRERTADRIGVDRGCQRDVELDDVRAQFDELLKAGKPCAHIVQRQPCASGPNGGKLVEQNLLIADIGMFGQFQHCAAAGRAIQRLCYQAGFHSRRGGVDRQIDGVRQGRKNTDCPLDDRQFQFHAHADAFGLRKPDIGCAVRRSVKAGQHFEPLHRAGMQVADRLKRQIECVARYDPAQQRRHRVDTLAMKRSGIGRPVLLIGLVQVAGRHSHASKHMQFLCDRAIPGIRVASVSPNEEMSHDKQNQTLNGMREACHRNRRLDEAP